MSGAFIFVALGTALVMLRVAILIEALVLRLLKWASGWVCLAASVMANFASALLGCILVPVIGKGSNLLPASTLGLLDVVWPWVFWPAAILFTGILGIGSSPLNEGGVSRRFCGRFSG